MRVVTLLLSCLATCIGTVVLAGGQNQLSDPKQAIAQAFWKDLYGQGGSTLYCGKAFTGEDGTLVASPIYSIKQLKRAMRCITERQCTIMNPRYPFIEADLHNHYPALARVELKRRNAQFAELSDDVPSTFADIDCDMKTSYQLVEPRDEAKGNIARAIFYMHVEYDLPIVGLVPMYKAWHRLDPPDAEEKARNDRIEALQGTRNRFIDDPSLVDRLIAD
ncbi:endonuclease [Pseudomonas sp. AA-38]|uniref:endonuclease n=1 Tax=Pseudomonas sp. AA-38 TaxID=3028807 RepID=UPI0023F86767|nr:endonuclease [Pseudomonas sp. AA-38]